jgi:hypothetical protein
MARVNEGPPPQPDPKSAKAHSTTSQTENALPAKKFLVAPTLESHFRLDNFPGDNPSGAKAPGDNFIGIMLTLLAAPI